MRYAQARHEHWQRTYADVLARQDVVDLDDDRRDELGWNLADATASRTRWDAVHTALVGELTHRGISEDFGDPTLQRLADTLLRAVQTDPEPPADAYAASARGWLARRRRERAARRGHWFTIDPWGQDPDVDRALFAAVLQALRPWARELQTDLPLSSRTEWPHEVAAAADHLHRASPRQRGDSDVYATTGWLPARDDATWAAFALFAPYALSAEVVAEGVRALVEAADGGTTLVLRFDADQHAAVTAVLLHRHLRPLR